MSFLEKEWSTAGFEKFFDSCVKWGSIFVGMDFAANSLIEYSGWDFWPINWFQEVSITGGMFPE